MKLKLGIMTNAEIAEWMGIKPTSFRKHKAQYMPKLDGYAEYEVVRGGVKITRIIQDTYVKKESKAYSEVKAHFDTTWSADGFDTCKHVSEELYAARIPRKEDGTLVSQGTCYEYTRAVRRELYGIPQGEPGKLGTCENRWGKAGPDGKPVPLTEQEEEIRRKYLKKYLGSASERTIEVLELIEHDRLDPAYAWDYYSYLMNNLSDRYKDFLEAMRGEGIVLKQCTQIHRNFPG